MTFYQCFIKTYFQIIIFLTDFMKKFWVLTNKILSVFTFINEIHRVFQKLKKYFISAFILMHHDSRQHIHIKLNVLEYAVTVILLKLCDDEQWHSVTFWSYKMTDMKICYKMHDEEMLIICKRASFNSYDSLCTKTLAQRKKKRKRDSDVKFQNFMNSHHVSITWSVSV